MKIGYTTVCINPTFPIKPAGFIQQTQEIFEFHDDLQAHILAFEDSDTVYYLVSLDSLGVALEVQETLRSMLEDCLETNKQIVVTLSATHTHFAGDAKVVEYQKEILSAIMNGIQSIEMVEYDSLSISYQCVPFMGVGKSRISGHEANVLLQLFTIYADNKPLIYMIVHNCHPTIHHGETPYFTSEYPGYVISELSKKYPNVFFTFLQGAAGDVSTRFTRPSQDYVAVEYLGNKLIHKIEELMNQESKKVPLNKIEYESTLVPLDHEFNPIDLSNLPNNLTERELATIHIGVRVREDLATKLDTLDKSVMISKLELGPYKLVYCPNEAFSSYIDCIDTSVAALVCYSNGYSPYITGINDDFITYEKFTDTVTKKSKQDYIRVLNKYGH